MPSSRTLSCRIHAAMLRGLTRAGDRERGDVPGWVLITLMTAGLVAGLWKLAGPTFSNMFSNAVSSVSGS